MSRKLSAPDLERERQAAAALLQRFEDEAAADQTFAHDLVEGQTAFFEIAEHAVSAMANDDMLVAALKAQEAKLKERRQRLEARAERWRDALFSACKFMGASLELASVTLSVRALPKKPIILDEKEVPEAFLKVETKIDRSAIERAMKKGEAVPGVTWDNGGETLAISKR